MQEHGGAAAEAAILAGERTISVSLRVDWDQDGKFENDLSELSPFVSNVKLDRALSGSAPEEILLIEGAAAAELSATLGGEFEGQQLPWIFSPYNRLSPLYGKPLVGVDIEYDIIIETPVGEFVYPQFRGQVRTTAPNRGDNTLELTALDRVELLRKPVQLPPWAVSEEHANYGELSKMSLFSRWVIDHCLRLCDISPSPYRPAFREELNVPDNGLDGVQFYMSGNGGWLPTIGWLDNLNANTFPNPGEFVYSTFAPRHPDAPLDGRRPSGLYGLGNGISDARVPNSQGYLHYWSLDRDLINPRAAHVMGMTLMTEGTNASPATIAEHPALEVVIGGYYYLYIMIANGQVWTRRRYAPPSGTAVNLDSPKVNIPTGVSNIDIVAIWDNSPQTGSRAYIRARPTGQSTGGNESNFATVLGPGLSDASLYDHIKGRVRIGHALGMGDVYYATRNIFNANIPFMEQSSLRKAKYPASLDAGLNRLSHMPSREAKDAWDIITEVAAAEFGSVFFDESGVFRFWDWDRMLAKQNTPVRVLTLDQVSGLNFTNSLDSVRNVITVQATKKRAVFGAVYESGDADEFYIPPAETKIFKVWVDDVVSPLTFRMEDQTAPGGDPATTLSHYRHYTLLDNDLPQGGNDGSIFNMEIWDEDAVQHGYVVSFRDPVTFEWREVNDWRGYVIIDQYFSGDGFLTVRVRNRTGDRPIRLATQGGSPAYHMGGTKIIDYGTQSVISRGRASIQKYGARNLELDGDWYQDTTATLDLITKMRERTEDPIPSTDAITIAGDPRLQLGDAIMISDPDGFGDDLHMQILGISREWDIEAGLIDTLSVEMLAPGTESPQEPDQPPQHPGYRYNLNPNPAFQVDKAGWFPTSATIVTGVTGLPRTTALRIPAAGDIVAPRASVTAGMTYRLSEYLKGDGVAASGTFQVHWYGANQYLGATTSQNWTVTQAGVTRLDTGSVVAPAGADQMLLFAKTNNAVLVSCSLYEPGSALGEYFDGATLGAKWDGTVGSSSSTLDLSKIPTPAPSNLLNAATGFSDTQSATLTMPNDLTIDSHLVLAVLSGNKGVGTVVPPAGTTTRATYSGASVSGVVASGAGMKTGTFAWGVDFEAACGLFETNIPDATFVTSATFPNPVNDNEVQGVTGDLGAATAAGTVFAIVGVDSSWSNGGGAWSQNSSITWSGSYRHVRTVQSSDGQYGGAAFMVAAKDVKVGDPTAVTVSWDGPADQAYMHLLFFSHSGSYTYGPPAQNPDPGGGNPGNPSEDGVTAAATLGWGTPHPISDEFNYTGAPDPNKWGNSPAEGMPGHNGNGRRIAYACTVGNGMMTLRGYPNGDTGWVRQKLETRYGRWEARMRSRNIGSSGGLYHVLNLIWPTKRDGNEGYKEYWPEDGEYDWVEYNDPDGIQDDVGGWLHYPHPDNVPIQQIRWTAPEIDPRQWHNYAFEWSPSGLKGWVDGVQRYSYSGGAGPNGRKNIQDMPSGHLVHQLDNFTGDGGLREAVQEIAWSRFYPL